VTWLEMLKAIERCDPDGGEVEPTPANYGAHERWAVASFGREVWEHYQKGGWGEGSGV